MVSAAHILTTFLVLLTVHATICAALQPQRKIATPDRPDCSYCEKDTECASLTCYHKAMICVNSMAAFDLDKCEPTRNKNRVGKCQSCHPDNHCRSKLICVNNHCMADFSRQSLSTCFRYRFAHPIGNIGKYLPCSKGSDCKSSFCVKHKCMPRSKLR